MADEQMSPEQMKQLEDMKKKVLTSILDREAFERINRIRLVNPQLAGQVEMYLIQLFQSGKLQSQLTDEQMKQILQMLQAGKKDFNIKFR